MRCQRTLPARRDWGSIDTNGGGSSTTPTNGDWVGIYDNSLTIPSPYYFNWSNIHYDDSH